MVASYSLQKSHNLLKIRAIKMFRVTSSVSEGGIKTNAASHRKAEQILQHFVHQHQRNPFLQIASDESTNSAMKFKTLYDGSNAEERQKYIIMLSKLYPTFAPNQDIVKTSFRGLNTIPGSALEHLKIIDNVRRFLEPPYRMLFISFCQISGGILFLIKLREQLLRILNSLRNSSDSTDDSAVQRRELQMMDESLKEILSTACSRSLLHVHKLTWSSPGSILQKVAEYEAVHRVRHWLDIKKRVGLYRRCFYVAHPSLLGEPIVILHVALHNNIATSIQELLSRDNEADQRNCSNLDEDKSVIKAATFYSISMSQPGLRGIELGSFMIKEAVDLLRAEFPDMTSFSSLSPIPGFREWLQSHSKHTGEDISIYKILSAKSLAEAEFAEQTLLRLCAHYLLREKRRGFALNSVLHFHARNGAELWRLIWKADTSTKGFRESFGIMMNCRYSLEDLSARSENYQTNGIIPANELVTNHLPDVSKL